MVIEESLDPADWDSMKSLARRMAEDMVSYHQNIRQVLPLVVPSKEILDSITEPLPEDPLGPEKTYKEFQEKILKNHGALACHPGCWNTVMGTGTTLGALADMWMSGLNSLSTLNITLGSRLERQVISWFKEMLHYPSEASGVLVSGGSMANLLGLAVARNAKAGYDVREEGLHGRLAFYGSDEMHYSIQKDLEVLGVGRRGLRKIRSDQDFKIDLDDLRRKVDEDRKAGVKPVCVVGCAGTTNTGSFDDLEALADFCENEDLWFHVDGAFGAWAAISPKYRHLVKGMERADSLAFDLHKWMYMPYGIGCILVRDRETHYKSFAEQADYIKHEEGLIDYTLELSRPSRSLKAWMSLKEHGAKKYSRIIEQNIEQAKYVAERVKACPELELMAPVPLNIVCLRYRKPGMDEQSIMSLNRMIGQKWFQQLPGFLPGTTTVRGKYTFRICITNHRTTRKDLDSALDWILRTGRELSPA